MLALFAGALLDRIADPHRVDLLSAPLLWLVVAYLGALAVLLLTSLWTVNTFTGEVDHTGRILRVDVFSDAPGPADGADPG